VNAAQKPVLVQKFGGSALADGEGFEACVAVIRKHAETHRIVVLLSAVKGVTDGLIGAIDAAVQGQSAEAQLAAVLERERTILEALAGNSGAFSGAGQYLEAQSRELKERLEGVRLLRQCPDETRARILASGEAFSSRLMAQVLEGRGFSVRWNDADVLPLANADWLDSLVDIEAAGPKLAECLKGDVDVLVLPGFYGINSDGAIQLLGRNGTDYSASAVAAALGAERCQIWKDIDGFFSADPTIVSNAVCLDEVSYAEAIELT
jgi:aspartokinase/homoserine dehydrogenase 1